MFNTAYALYGLMLKDIAAKPIDSVGRINNNAPIHQALPDSFNMPRLRIVRVNMQQHAVKINDNRQPEPDKKQLTAFFFSQKKKRPAAVGVFIKNSSLP